MLERKITENDIVQARKWANQIVNYDKKAKPYFGGDVFYNMIGKLGELKFLQWCDFKGIEYFKDMMPRTSHFAGSFDFYIKGKNIDVKTKTWKQGNPTEEWDVGVASQQIKNKTDYYVFLLVNLNRAVAQLWGFLSKKLFLQRSSLHRKGERVSDHFVVLNDVRNVQIKDLIKIEEFISYFDGNQGLDSFV